MIERATQPMRVYTVYIMCSKMQNEKTFFIGLGLSRSRLRMNEESSDDELGKMIKQRQKKFQKSENIFFVD